MEQAARETDLARFSRIMKALGYKALHGRAWVSSRAVKRRRLPSLVEFPFASISVLVILLTLLTMSIERGGWTWSSWTYSFALFIMVPLVTLELKRKAVITGGAVVLLFFMVLIDAGMPGYLGYSPSDANWYDNIAHLLGASALTLFLWSFLCWGLSSEGVPRTNGTRKFVLTIGVMTVISVFFEFTEFFTDAFFGWTNFHPGVDTVGDLIFDFAGILTAGIVIARHRVSIIRRPFWHAEATA